MKYVFAGSLLVIFLFALMPGQMTPAVIVNHDKAAHAAAFFLLAFMVQRSFVMMPLSKRLMWLVLMAVSIEMLQYLVAHRGFSLEDLAYDALGIALYTAVTIPLKLASKVFADKAIRSNERIEP